LNGKEIKNAKKEKVEMNGSDRMSVECDKLIDSRTLNVMFKNVGIELEFVFCSKYNLILIAVKRQKENGLKYEDPTIFMELFDGHKMMELPLALSKEQRLLENGSLAPYFCAFSWAQELGGSYIFDTMSSDKTRKREIINLTTLGIALKARKEHRISLQNQIKQLMAFSNTTSNDNKYKVFIKNIQKSLDDKNKNKGVPMNKLLSFKLMKKHKKLKQQQICHLF
jgi:hypothetical protein